MGNLLLTNGTLDAQQDLAQPFGLRLYVLTGATTPQLLFKPL